jgi:RimJ/RimL family protein N-acetyltransferase
VIADGVRTLAPLRPADAATHLAGEDAELVRWRGGGPGTLPGVEACIRSTLDQWAAGGPELAFGVRVESALAGAIDVNLAPPEAELSHGLHPGWRGRGFATRAVRLACDHLREHRGARLAVTRTDPRNRPSAAVAVRAGFSAAAPRRDDDGELMDVRTPGLR